MNCVQLTGKSKIENNRGAILIEPNVVRLKQKQKYKVSQVLELKIYQLMIYRTKNLTFRSLRMTPFS